MIIKKLSELDSNFRATVEPFILALDKGGYRYAILETRRLSSVQAAYYAQGREPAFRVHELRMLAGLWPISDAEAGRVVTWAKHSYHEDGLAIDIVPVNPNGSIPWVVRNPETASRWLSLGSMGEDYGLEWGGRWRPIDKWSLGRDTPHYQKVGLK